MAESAEITIGQYMCVDSGLDGTSLERPRSLERLKQLGVTAIFGVPGDFTLAFLDLIEDSDIEWLGFCNELNASYAGLARAKKGLAVLCTTFGVGELSAACGIAGSFSERVPVLHLVGVPSTKLQAHRALLHHTLGDNRFDAFSGVASHITAAQAFLTSKDSNANGAPASAEIDRVLRTALLKQRPTYLTLPTDLVFAKIPRQPLDTPLTPKSILADALSTPIPPDLIADVTSSIKTLFTQAKRPIFVVDACARRFHVVSEVEKLIRAAGVPWFSTPMAKGVLSEYDPLFSGVYIGSVSLPEVKALVESADLVINIGSLKSDFNTGSFTYKFTAQQQVELHSDHAFVQYARYELPFHVLLPELVKALAGIPHPEHFKPLKNGGLKLGISTGPLEQDKLWPHLAHFLKSDDILLTETGTSSFGILDAAVPPGCLCHSQVLWGSIGYATGSIVGVAYAAKELGRRAVLVTGEGSAQVTIQDLSQLIRLKLNPILVILNNNGYTIERFIHGKTRHYNDVPQWQWQNTLAYFGGQENDTKSYSVKTGEELTQLFENEILANASKVQLVELHLDQDDAPRPLRIQADLSGKANSE